MIQKVLNRSIKPCFTTKPKGLRTGFGLFLSYDIVKAHSGELLVKTKEGEGMPACRTVSTFSIQLPITN